HYYPGMLKLVTCNARRKYFYAESNSFDCYVENLRGHFVSGGLGLVPASPGQAVSARDSTSGRRRGCADDTKGPNHPTRATQDRARPLRHLQSRQRGAFFASL